jgi:hypothetical protein
MPTASVLKYDSVLPTLSGSQLDYQLRFDNFNTYLARYSESSTQRLAFVVPMACGDAEHNVQIHTFSSVEKHQLSISVE